MNIELILSHFHSVWYIGCCERETFNVLMYHPLSVTWTVANHYTEYYVEMVFIFPMNFPNFKSGGINGGAAIDDQLERSISCSFYLHRIDRVAFFIWHRPKQFRVLLWENNSCSWWWRCLLESSWHVVLVTCHTTRERLWLFKALLTKRAARVKRLSLRGTEVWNGLSCEWYGSCR